TPNAFLHCEFCENQIPLTSGLRECPYCKGSLPSAPLPVCPDCGTSSLSMHPKWRELPVSCHYCRNRESNGDLHQHYETRIRRSTKTPIGRALDATPGLLEKLECLARQPAPKALGNLALQILTSDGQETHPNEDAKSLARLLPKYIRRLFVKV